MWLNIRDAAAYCGFSAAYLRSLARAGKVKAVRPSGRYRFRREWLDEFMLGGVLATPRTAHPAAGVKNGRRVYHLR